MPYPGKRDQQSVSSGGGRYLPIQIAGVEIRELGNVLTRSGYMTEVFRSDWSMMDIAVKQVNWVNLNADGVTDWHCHAKQTDRLIGVGGNIKLALWDGRPASKTHGATEIIRFGAIRPVMVIVPPGVWHGLRNESGTASGYLNVVDQLYVYSDPDNFRAPSTSMEIPDIL